MGRCFEAEADAVVEATLLRVPVPPLEAVAAVDALVALIAVDAFALFALADRLALVVRLSEKDSSSASCEASTSISGGGKRKLVPR